MVIMAVPMPTVIIGREPCPQSYPRRSLAALDRVAGLAMPDPVVVGPGLAAVLSTLPDPRKRRGVRHGLFTLVSVAVCAVAAGARSFVAIAEWAVDMPVEAAAALGTASPCHRSRRSADWCSGWILTGSTW